MLCVQSRFANDERVYKAFLEILNMYRKGMKSIQQVYDEVGPAPGAKSVLGSTRLGCPFCHIHVVACARPHSHPLCGILALSVVASCLGVSGHLWYSNMSMVRATGVTGGCALNDGVCPAHDTQRPSFSCCPPARLLCCSGTMMTC